MVIKTCRGCFCKNSALSVSMRMMRLFALGLSSCFRAESRKTGWESMGKERRWSSGKLESRKILFFGMHSENFCFLILFGMQSPKSAYRIYGTCLKKILTMKLIARPAYLEKLIGFKEKQLIKDRHTPLREINLAGNVPSMAAGAWCRIRSDNCHRF